MKPYLRNLGIGMAVVGIILFFLFPDIITSMKKPIELYAEETDATQISAKDHVSAEIYAVFDYFATETTVDENTGATISSEGTTYFYLIPAFVPGDEYTHYFAVRANTKSSPETRKTLSTIMKDTQAYMNYETETFGETVLEMDAICMKLDEELTELMYDYFRELDYTEDEIKTYVHPYFLRELNHSNAKIMMVISIVLVVVGLALVVSMIVLIKKENSRIKNQTEVVINGVAYPKEMFGELHQLAIRRNPNAVPMLMELTGLSQQEAAKVIGQWGKYYYF